MDPPIQLLNLRSDETDEEITLSFMLWKIRRGKKKKKKEEKWKNNEAGSIMADKVSKEVMF